MKRSVLFALAAAIVVHLQASLQYSAGRLSGADDGGRACFAANDAWQLVFHGGERVTATDSERKPGAFSEKRIGDGIESRWQTPRVDITVRVRKRTDGTLEITSSLRVKEGVVTDFMIPGPIRFLSSDLQRFVHPGYGAESSGVAFNRRFFEKKLSYERPYPALFADWVRLEMTGGSSFNVYAIRKRGGFLPWRNPRPFVPGRLKISGDGTCGEYVHVFSTWLKKGESMEFPPVLVSEGGTVDESLAGYLRENGLGRSLEEKCSVNKSPKFLAKLAASPMLLIYGTAGEIRHAIERMPSPSIIHNTSYKRGGQDGGNPDCLPPEPTFGTPREFRELVDFIHEKDSLFIPYVNPTYWCEKPKFETFTRVGMDAVARNRDGSPIKLQYGVHPCFNITYFHPEVRAANERVRKWFSVDYPADAMFQDQCGSLPWFRDFSPHSPSPCAHSEGMISIVEEDSRTLPLMTEDGWDMVADNEIGLTGLAWAVVPLEDMCGRKLYKQGLFPADTYLLEPIAQRMFRDKLLFYHHDLAGFATNDRTLAWMLALGYNLVYRCDAKAYVGDENVRSWYAWLHVLQSKVLSRTVGGRVTYFHHDRAPLFARGIDPATPMDDGVIEAQYGEVEFLVNLGEVPRTAKGYNLAPYGWWIKGPGVVAGKLVGADAFVETADGRFAQHDGTCER